MSKVLYVKEGRKMNSIKRIEVIYDNRLVGRWALTKESLCAFEYSAEWLNSGFSISPFELPLRSGVFIAKPRPFDGGFGVFDDCLPDGWGLLILDRYLQQNGIKPCVLSLLDRLVLVGSTGRGALVATIITERELRSSSIEVVLRVEPAPKSLLVMMGKNGW